MTYSDRLTSPESRACYQRVQSRLEARSNWREAYAFGLVPVAEHCAAYLSFAREVRALKDVHPEDLRALEAAVERTRAQAREGLAMFAVFPFARVPLAAVNAEGIDAEIAALCSPISLEWA